MISLLIIVVVFVVVPFAINHWLFKKFKKVTGVLICTLLSTIILSIGEISMWAVSEFQLSRQVELLEIGRAHV